MLVERMEYGPAIIEPVALQTPEGRIEVKDAAFEEKLDALIERSAEVREELLTIERKKIGAISRELKALEKAERTGGVKAEVANVRRAELQGSFEKLQAEATEIRAKLAESVL
jgi:low affinity Fe/Cu permease